MFTDDTCTATQHECASEDCGGGMTYDEALGQIKAWDRDYGRSFRDAQKASEGWRATSEPRSRLRTRLAQP